MGKNEFKVQFKIADESHVDQMYEIEKTVFPVPWSYESLSQDVCEHEIAVYVVGIYNDKVISYAGLWHVMEESHITNIAVREEFRRMGIGGKMMDILSDVARKLGVKTITLEVRESNKNAIAMYEKAGFEVMGRRKKYYTDNYEDALVMNKTI